MLKRRLANRKEKVHILNTDIFIERLKKIRALNCTPSDVGMDNCVLWKLALDRSCGRLRFF